MKMKRYLGLMLLGTMLITPAVRAEGPLLSIAATAESAVLAVEGQAAAPASFTFTQGTWDLSVYGGAVVESFGGRGEVVSFFTVAPEFFLLDDVAFVPEFVAYSVNQDAEDSLGFGFNLMGRWYALKFEECRLAMYLETGVGLSEFNYRTPGPNGTHFNFNVHAGIGARWSIADNISLIVGARYFHLSNAETHGEERNPSIDAFGGYGGVTINF